MGQREKLGCDAVTTKASADPIETMSFWTPTLTTPWMQATPQKGLWLGAEWRSSQRVIAGRFSCELSVVSTLGSWGEDHSILSSSGIWASTKQTLACVVCMICISLITHPCFQTFLVDLSKSSFGFSLLKCYFLGPQPQPFFLFKLLSFFRRSHWESCLQLLIQRTIHHPLKKMNSPK